MAGSRVVCLTAPERAPLHVAMRHAGAAAVLVAVKPHLTYLLWLAVNAWRSPAGP